MKKRNSFIFYSSYFDAVQDLPPTTQGAMYKAIVEYAMIKKEPTLSGLASTLFKLIKPNIDAGIRRYENGLKGGRPSETENKPRNNLDGTETKPKDNLDKTENKPNNNLEETKTKPRTNLEETESKPKGKPKRNLIYQDNNQEQEQELELEQDKEQELEQDKQTDCGLVGSSDIKNYFLEILQEKVDRLKNSELLDVEFIQRLNALFSELARMDNVKINGAILSTDIVLEKLVGIFAHPDNEVIESIIEVFETVDNKPDIKNKRNYTIGVLYNKALGF